MSKPYDVKIGQVYMDNDKRMAARSLRVVDIVVVATGDKGPDKSYAVCAVGLSGRTVKIKLRRFRPNSTGYRLVRDEYGKAME